MAENGGFVAIGYAEMDTELYKATRGPQIKIYLSLCRYANWETGIARGAFSFFARAAGVAKSNALRQMKKLEKRGLLQFIKCRPGRRVSVPDWTEIQLLDFHGSPRVAVRNRTVIGAESHRYRRENAPNTDREDSSLNNQTGNKEGKGPIAGAAGSAIIRTVDAQGGVDGAARLYLRSLGFDDRAAAELTGIASLKILQAGWDITQKAIRKGTCTPAKALGYFRGIIRNQFRDAIKQTGTGQGESGATSNGPQVKVNPRDAANGLPARRKTSKEEENELLAKIDADIEAKRAASARRTVTVTPLRKALPCESP